MPVSVEKKPFGVTKDGESVNTYIIRNDVLAVEIMEYGATIRSLLVQHGSVRTDVVLGYDTLREYEENDGYLGACVGRVGNRIGGAAFALNGKTYTLAKNDGENHLHGGGRTAGRRPLCAHIAGRGRGVSRNAARRRELPPAGEHAGDRV